MSSDGRYVITCAEEPVLHVWDTDTGVLLRKINVKLKKDYILTKCGFCCDDSQLILNTEKELSASSRLVLINFETGTLLDMPTHNNDNYSVFAEGKTKAVVLYKNKVYIVDLKSGEDIWGPVRDSDKVVESTSMDYLVCGMYTSTVTLYTVKSLQENLNQIPIFQKRFSLFESFLHLKLSLHTLPH